MLERLGMVASSEYANAGDLMGIDTMTSSGLVRELDQLDPVARARFMQKLMKQSQSIGSRAEMEKFFSELPPHIKEGLLAGKLRLADTLIYTVKPVSGAKTIKMFETQDVKEKNLRNISNGRLPKNTAMLVSGIVLLQGVGAAGVTADEQKSTVFDTIDTVGALANGEFSLKANKKQIIPECGNYVFRTKDFSKTSKGYYKLANPRLIHDDVEIEWEIELGTLTGVNANAILYGALHGTVTIP